MNQTDSFAAGSCIFGWLLSYSQPLSGAETQEYILSMYQ